MNVGDICNRVVATIGANQTAQEAAELMRTLHVGTLVVTEPDSGQPAPVGILTDRDLTIDVMAEGLNPEEVLVADIMTSNPVMAEEDQDVSDALDAMSSEGIRRVPVLNQERALVGILALDDVMHVLARDMERMADIVGTQMDTAV
ncbi:MAG TPA: CBS domain-containing protein [Gammaproteobacteria bacterium]|nr:CBS domain-containing protein [Gammaproteobacteria bacterium]